MPKLPMVPSRDDGQPLMTSPQLLGVLPSWRFWMDSRNVAFARPFIVASYVLTAIVTLAAGLLSLRIDIIGPLSGVVSVVLVLGLLERHIRRRVMERRTRCVEALTAPTGDAPAVPRAASDPDPG